MLSSMIAISPADMDEWQYARHLADEGVWEEEACGGDFRICDVMEEEIEDDGD